MLYDAHEWVNRTSVIIVTVNYRLGALGFLYQSSGVDVNNGIEDQRVALRWVQQNIASFGGSAARITLMGQSAGATSIGYHLLSPRSTNLFSQVIAMSNPLSLPLKNPTDGKKFGDVFMKHLGCTPNDLKCLQHADVADIIKAQDETNKHFDILDPFLLFYPWTPIVDMDGDVERQPIKLLSAGQGLQVPGVFGTVQNEALIFIFLAFGNKGMSSVEYYAFIADAFPLHIAEVERFIFQ